MDRRALLAAGVGAVASLARTASARDYTSASEVLDTIDGLARDVAASLDAIAASLPGARPLADSVGADHARQRADRDAIRRRFGLAASAPPAAAAPSRDLGALRALQQELVHAHAEGLPALDDPQAVQALAGHLVDLSRHLTVIELWSEAAGAE
jgi:hypothetical protein